MIIRQATQADYDKIMELYNDFVGEDRYSTHNNDSFFQVIGSAQHAIFVAEVDGTLIGMASVSLRHVIRYKKPIAELDELFVSSKLRSHGTGSSLMEAVEAFALENNCHRLYIESAYQHEAAHTFYEHLGYKNNGYHFYKPL